MQGDMSAQWDGLLFLESPLIVSVLKGEAHAAVIGFRLVVHYIENALGARQCGHQAHQLIGDVVDRSAKLPCVCEIKPQTANREIGSAGSGVPYNEEGADNSGGGITNTYHLPDDRHQRHAERIGRNGRITKFFTSPVEFFHSPVFIMKCFYNTDSLNDLFRVFVDEPQLTLLQTKPGLAFQAECAACKYGQYHEQKREAE